jgi:hypothetical protein
MANGRGGGMKRLRRFALLLLLALPTGCVPSSTILRAVMPRTQPTLPLSAPFSKQQLAGVIYPTEIHWLGNDKLLFRGSDPSKDLMKSDGKKALYLWDLKGPARLLLPRSQSLCVRGNEVLVGLDDKSATQLRWLRLQRPTYRLEPTSELSKEEASRILRRSGCDKGTIPDYFLGRHWDWLPNGAGYLDYGRSEDRPRLNQPVYYWDPDLRRRQDTRIRLHLPPMVMVEGSEFDQSFLIYPSSQGIIKADQWEKDKFYRIWRLKPDFTAVPIDVPHGPWVGDSFRFFHSRRGLIITNNDFSRNFVPRQAGAYLLSAQWESQRLERGFVQDLVVSGDGCRLAYAYQFRLDADIDDGGKRLVAVDLCGNTI